MALFPETRSPYDVYSFTEAVGWSEPTWSYDGEILMRIEPVAANEEIMNNQDNQNISEIGFIDIEYDGIVKPNSFIIDRADGTQFQNRGIPEKWKFLIPYIMVKLERPQSPATIPVST